MCKLYVFTCFPDCTSLWVVICVDAKVLMQADCLAATALQLLLKVKRHLKIVYSLNDARCQVKL